MHGATTPPRHNPLLPIQATYAAAASGGVQTRRSLTLEGVPPTPTVTTDTGFGQEMEEQDALVALDSPLRTIQRELSNPQMSNLFLHRLRRTRSRTLLARRRRCLRRRNPTSARASVKPLRSPLFAAWTTVKCLTCGSPRGGDNTPRTMCSSCRSWRANTPKTMLEPSTSSEASIPNWLWPASTSMSPSTGRPCCWIPGLKNIPTPCAMSWTAASRTSSHAFDE